MQKMTIAIPISHIHATVINYRDNDGIKVLKVVVFYHLETTRILSPQKKLLSVGFLDDLAKILQKVESYAWLFHLKQFNNTCSIIQRDGSQNF